MHSWEVLDAFFQERMSVPCSAGRRSNNRNGSDWSDFRSSIPMQQRRRTSRRKRRKDDILFSGACSRMPRTRRPPCRPISGDRRKRGERERARRPLTLFRIRSCVAQGNQNKKQHCMGPADSKDVWEAWVTTFYAVYTDK